MTEADRILQLLEFESLSGIAGDEVIEASLDRDALLIASDKDFGDLYIKRKRNWSPRRSSRKLSAYQAPSPS